MRTLKFINFMPGARKQLSSGIKRNEEKFEVVNVYGVFGYSKTSGLATVENVICMGK